MSNIISSQRAVPASIVLMTLLGCLGFASTLCNAQTGSVPVRMRSRSATGRAQAAKSGGQESQNQGTGRTANFSEMIYAPSQEATACTANIDFGKVAHGQVGLKICSVPVTAGNPIVNIDIRDSNKNDPSPLFRAERGLGSPTNPVVRTNNDQSTEQTKKDQNKAPIDPCRSDTGDVPEGTCDLVVGFGPSDDSSSTTATVTLQFRDETAITFTLKGQGDTALGCVPLGTFLPLRSREFNPGKLYPVTPAGITDEIAIAIYNELGDPIRKSVVNCYYSTNNSFSVFTQAQQIYNAASGASTVNAQLGSLNFSNGMQLTIATNPQIGSSNSSSTPTSTTPVVVPTLSAAAAAQAAQNILNGGTIFGFDLYPLLSRQGDFMVTVDGVLREGVDLQKFNNTSITATNPSTHTFAGLQGYMSYSSTNNASNSTGLAGSFFLGGMYGYSLMNHTYSLENGFGGRINSQLAQISAGVLLNNVVKIAVYRGFGPSQKYIDSTSMTQKVANNFQTWSIGIAYQSSGSGKAK